MKYPFTITNIHGELLTFSGIERNQKGEEVLIVENQVQPKAGPPMHTHWKQDESLTVVSGKMGYQLKGGIAKLAGPGETVTFLRGTPHKFWAEGNEVLRCKGWVSLPNTLAYFLSEIYKSMDANGGKPGVYDAAYLLKRYKSEYAMDEIPAFVQNVIFPIALFFGNLQGKGKKFANAPEPVR